MNSGSTITEVILFDDILSKIFLCLDPNDLLIVSIVNKQWKKVTEIYPDIWLQHTSNVWNKSNFNRPAIENVMERIESLPMSKLKATLNYVDVSRCIEKRDYQRMLLSHLLFSQCESNMLSTKANPLYHRLPNSQVKLFYPNWSLSMNFLKASYVYASIQAKRQKILVDELVSIEWIFIFNDFGEENSWISKFNSDFTMTSGLHDSVLVWKFVTDSDCQRMIQVESYPPLRSSRASDGSWRLKNLHVTFRQSKPIPPEKVPLY